LTEAGKEMLKQNLGVKLLEDTVEIYGLFPPEIGGWDETSRGGANCYSVVPPYKDHNDWVSLQYWIYVLRFKGIVNAADTSGERFHLSTMYPSGWTHYSPDFCPYYVVYAEWVIDVEKIH
jgi:hypothetical protein